MTEQGIDFSWARPSGAAIVASGKTFVIRYCPYAGDGGKGLTTDEITDYRAHGLSIGLVFESTASRPKGGRLTGLVDGKLAQQGAASVGFPDDLPIYFAVDYDAPTSDFPLIDEYLRACMESLGKDRIGVYGSYAVVQHCDAFGIWFLWQTYAWSAGVLYEKADLYQYKNGQPLNGGLVDYNEAYGEAGLWKPEEENMTLDELEARLVRLEWLLAGNGIDTADGRRLTGNNALEHATAKGWSAFLGIGQTRQRIANHEMINHNPSDTSGIDLAQPVLITQVPFKTGTPPAGDKNV